MTADPLENFDWSTTTYEGARLANHRLFASLTFAEKMQALEEMSAMSLWILESRKRRGLPCIDPYTKQPVPGRSAEANESPGEP